MKITEIIHALAELNLKITSEELNAPTRETVLRIYSGFLELFLGLQVADLFRQPPHMLALETIHFPQLYEDTIPIIHLYSKIEHLMREIKVDKFTIVDLFQPQKKKFLYHLACLINFARFREDKLAFYNQLIDQHQELAQERDRAQSEFEKISKEYQRYKTQQKSDAPLIEQLKFENEEILTEIRTMSQRQTTLQNENKQLKQSVHDVTEKYNTIKKVEEGLQDDVRSLEQQIVHNPEQFKSKIDNLNHSIAVVKQQSGEDEKTLKAIKQKRETLQNLIKHLGKRCSLMHECESEMQKFKSLYKEMKVTQSTIEDVKEKSNDMRNAELQQKRQISTLQSKIQQASNQHQTKLEAAQQAMEDSLRAKRILEKDMHNQQHVLQGNNQAIIDMKQKLDDVTRSHSEEMMALQNQYLRLEQHIRVYNDKLLNTLA